MNTQTKMKKVDVDHIKCVWGLLCSLSSVDQERNNISLFNIVEQVNIPAEYFAEQKKKNNLIFPLSYEIVLLWRRTLDLGISDEEIFADIKIKTIDPTGKILQEVLSPLKFPMGIKRLRSRFAMQGVLASMPGDYVHQIEIKMSDQNEFKTVLEIPYEIREVK